MQIFKKYFLLPTIVTVISFCAMYYFFGAAAFLAVVILTILEVTLSFDNAVINAKVLEKMSIVWQKRFINWGIWLAVFGTRIILPIVIVAIVSGLSFLGVINLAIFDQLAYAQKLTEAHYSIGAFGGIFLLLVALKYFIDDTKEVDWLKTLEKKLKKFASIESIEIILALLTLLTISYLVPMHALKIVIAGILGVIVFVILQGITNYMDASIGKVSASGFVLFMYLNVLDAAFSLDGVIGAFAISKNLIIIAVGLGIGAYFVRSFTVFMVEQKTLNELRYLEHGAHYAVFGLAICMIAGLVHHIPEIMTGLIGLCFVGASYLSSRYYTKNNG
jgi:uncharacterized protein